MNTDSSSILLNRLWKIGVNNLSHELLALIGCRILRDFPINSNESPTSDDDLSGDICSEWINHQLLSCLPFNTHFDLIYEVGYDAMDSAWQEGFHLVIFSDDSLDEGHASDLIEPYLECLDRLSISPLTDFDFSEEQMKQELTSSFTEMIRDWRQVVLTTLEKKAKLDT